VPSNIAEGCGRGTDNQLINYLNIAKGSLSELETQIIISSKLEYINVSRADETLNEIGEVQKMIAVFIKSFES